jgi:hypothetical protein
MNHAYASSQAKIMARVAAEMENTSAPVSDKTWNNLIEIGGWAKKHAPHPALVEEAIPEPGAKRTWMQVRRAALAIVDSVTGKRGTIEVQELAIRRYVLDSPDQCWQLPVGKQIFSQLDDDDGYICLTRFAINFSRDGGLDSCTHTPETQARYQALLKRKDETREIPHQGDR